MTWKIPRIQPATRWPVDPRAAFLMALCVVSAIPLVIAQTAPQSVDRTFPHLGVVMWGLALGLGSIATLWGMSRARSPHDINGAITEQIGCMSVGVAALIYGVAVMLYTSWPDGGFAGPLTLGFGGACLIRYRQLQKLLNGSLEIVQHAREDESP